MAKYQIDNIPSPIAFEAGNEMIRRTLQNAKNLLMTHMGDVPYDRLRGLDQSIFDLPIRAMREALLPELDRVMLWEPDAEVEDANCTLDENGKAIIEVTLSINTKA